MVTQTWQIAMLTMIVALLVRSFAAKRTQVAHWLWLIVVVKCVTPTLWGHSSRLFSQTQSAVAADDVPAIESAAISSSAEIMTEVADSSFADERDVCQLRQTR